MNPHIVWEMSHTSGVDQDWFRAYFEGHQIGTVYRRGHNAWTLMTRIGMASFSNLQQAELFLGGLVQWEKLS